MSDTYDPYGGPRITGNWPPAQPFSGAPDWLTGATATPAVPEPPSSVETERAGIATEERGLIEREQAEVAKPLEDALLDTMRQRRELMNRQIPTPGMPRLFDVQPPPQQNFADPMKALASPLVFLTLLGSAFSRGGGRAAMDAMTAAINGFHKGDEQALTLQLNNWKNSTDAVIKQNGIEMSRYNAAWRETEHDVGERQARISALAAETGDQQILAAVRSGNFQALHKMLEDRQKQLDKLEQERLRWFGPEGGEAGAGSDEEAKAIAEYRQRPYTGVSASRGVGRATMQKVYRLNPNYSEIEFFTRKGAETTAGRAPAAALGQSLKTIEGNINAVEAFERTIRANFDQLIQLARKVDVTGVPVMEKWVRQGRKALGNPDVAAFEAQWNTVIPELGRILFTANLNGALTEGARNEAMGLIPKAASVKQIEAIWTVLKRDFDNRHRGYTIQRDFIQDKLDAIARGQPMPSTPREGPTAPSNQPSGGASGDSDAELKRRLGIP